MKNIKSAIFISATVINSIIGIICGFFKPIGFIYMGIPVGIICLIILFTAPWEVLVNAIKEKRRIAQENAKLKAEAHKKMEEVETEIDQLVIKANTIADGISPYLGKIVFSSEVPKIGNWLCEVKKMKDEIKDAKWEATPKQQIEMAEKISSRTVKINSEMNDVQEKAKKEIAEYEASVIDKNSITEEVVEELPEEKVWEQIWEEIPEEIIPDELPKEVTTEEAAPKEKSLIEKVKEAADAGDIEAIRKLLKNNVPGDEQLLNGIKALLNNSKN